MEPDQSFTVQTIVVEDISNATAPLVSKQARSMKANKENNCVGKPKTPKGARPSSRGTDSTKAASNANFLLANYFTKKEKVKKDSESIKNRYL